MTEHFNILCNNCGQQIVFRPFQNLATCSSCGTHLKLEETEHTISTIVVDKNEFLTMQQQIIPSEQQKNHQKSQDYKKQLQELEKDWEKKLETFKTKNNTQMILPRKRQSMIFTLLGILLLVLGIFFWTSDSFLFIMGSIWLFSSGKEYYNAIKFEVAEQDYLDEKERLEIAISLL